MIVFTSCLLREELTPKGRHYLVGNHEDMQYTTIDTYQRYTESASTLVTNN
jgi:hypothetical protein